MIPLEAFPEAGMHLEGEIDSALLGLTEGNARNAGPISYRIEAQLFDTELLVRAWLAAPLHMRCDRCLHEFNYMLEVSDAKFSYEVQDDPVIDVTDDLREELILALPTYPKCDLIGKECQILDIINDFRLDKAPSPGVNCATPSGKSVWDALDQISGVPQQ